jgi:hypothetical protein
MTETTPTTEEPPRFAPTRAPAAMLRRPLPGRLEAAVSAKLVRDHAKLLERVDEAGRAYAELRSRVEATPGADRQARAQAALAGEAELPPPSQPGLRAELAEAEEVALALQDAVAASADRLLAAAWRKAPAAADELDREAREGVEAVRARLADLRDALAALSTVTAEAAWARWLAGAGGQRARPFGGGRGLFAETEGALTMAGQAFGFELDRIEGRRREAEAVLAEQAKGAPAG